MDSRDRKSNPTSAHAKNFANAVLRRHGLKKYQKITDHLLLFSNEIRTLSDCSNSSFPLASPPSTILACLCFQEKEAEVHRHLGDQHRLGRAGGLPALQESRNAKLPDALGHGEDGGPFIT